MVVNDVDDAAHAARMNGVDQFAEILQRAEFRVDAPVIADGIRRAHAALSRPLADRMNRKEPDDVNTQVPDPVKILLQRLECAFFCMVPDKDGIDDLIPQFQIRIDCQFNFSDLF